MLRLSATRSWSTALRRASWSSVRSVCPFQGACALATARSVSSTSTVWNSSPFASAGVSTSSASSHSGVASPAVIAVTSGRRQSVVRISLSSAEPLLPMLISRPSLDPCFLPACWPLGRAFFSSPWYRSAAISIVLAIVSGQRTCPCSS